MGMPSTSAEKGSVSRTESLPPMSIHSGAISRQQYSLEHSGLQTGGFGHHALVPGRVEGQLHTRLANCRDPLDFVLDIVHQDIPHPASGRRESDLDLDRPRAILVRFHLATVHETELDDVD